uniref:CCHC-type domain-containing protein n=2 Tax=Brassica oleracea TaxID=3712 RepID=A0A0D3E9Y3_BRAOL|nr:unnamed protein product [Brassica oleracea]
MFDNDEKRVRNGDRPFTIAKRSNCDVLDQNELQTYANKSKAVKTTSKAHSTRCFKCHTIGHYANMCQKQRLVVTLENENVETKQEKEDSLPIFDDVTYEPMEGLEEEQIHDLKTNLFEEEGNDVPRFVDQSIGDDQHGDQDVLNNLTEKVSIDDPIGISIDTPFAISIDCQKTISIDASS